MEETCFSPLVSMLQRILHDTRIEQDVPTKAENKSTLYGVALDQLYQRRLRKAYRSKNMERMVSTRNDWTSLLCELLDEMSTNEMCEALDRKTRKEILSRTKSNTAMEPVQDTDIRRMQSRTMVLLFCTSV